MALLGSAGPTFAQDELDTAAARALFQQGVDLAGQGDWSGAADRFERSNALRASPVVAYNLASAWAELGRLVEASELLRQIERDKDAKPRLQKSASSLLAELSPRIATLVVTVESTPPPPEVRVNERPLPDAALGVPTPIDPGAVEVTVVENGRVLWTKRIDVTPGGQERITIELPEIAPTSAAPVPTTVSTTVPTPRQTAERASAATDGPRAPTGAAATRDQERAFYEEPWVWAGAGAVVVAGVIIAVLAASGDDAGNDGDVPITGSRLNPGTLTVNP